MTIATETSTDQFAANQENAAAAIGVSDAEWNVLKKQPGFPPRTKQGWDIAAISGWLHESEITESPSPKAGRDFAPRVVASADAGYHTITVTMPLCAPVEGTYIADQAGRFNTRLDRQTQLTGFRQLHAGLRATNATFGDGRPVDSASDVLRWLFEQITRQI